MAIEEPSLPQTATHSGLAAKGTILGLEGRTVVPVLGAVVISILLLSLLVVGGSGQGLGWRIVGACLPTALTILFVLGWVHRRPPHFARDWWHWRLVAGRAKLGAGERGVFQAHPLRSRQAMGQRKLKRKN